MAPKVKCSNCSKDAQYTQNDTGWSIAHFCASCLPSSLQDRAKSGQLPLFPPATTKKSFSTQTNVKPVKSPAPAEDSASESN